MAHVLASDGLTPWGQAGAIILALYLFLSIIIGLALVAALMFGLAWIRQKAELLRQLRPQVMQMNQVVEVARRGDPLPSQVADNRIIAAVAQAPRVAENIAARASSIEQSVDRGSQRVADVVIELHARTVMIKGMAKAFFFPGLIRVRRAAPGVYAVQAEQEQEAEREQEVEQAAVVEQSQVEEPPMEQEIIIRRR